MKYGFDYFFKNEKPCLDNLVGICKEFKYATSLANEEGMKVINAEYLPYKLQIEENALSSEAKIHATLNGDFKFINHACDDHFGIEEIDGKLCKWEYNFGESFRSIQVEQVNPIDIGIVSIFNGVIKTYPHRELKKLERTPQALIKYFKYIEDQRMISKKEDGIFKKLLYVVIIFFVVFAIFVAIINIVT